MSHATEHSRPRTSSKSDTYRSTGSAVLAATFVMIALIMMVPPVLAAAKISVVGLFKDKALIVVNGKQRLMRAGETSPEGITLHSASSKEAVIEIDGVRKSYELGGHFGGRIDGPQSTKVHLYANSANMFESVGSVNGFPINFIVDTGATLVSMNSIEARRMGINYRLTGRPSTSSTASGRSRVYLVMLDRVQLGDISLRNVQGAIHDGAFPERALLGMSFLSRLDMQRKGKVMELERKRYPASTAARRPMARLSNGIRCSGSALFANKPPRHHRLRARVQVQTAGLKDG